MGEPADETDDFALVRRRLGLADHTRILRVITKAGPIDPLSEGLWLFQIGIPAEWDWSTSLEPPWWWSHSPDKDGSELTVRYVLLRLTLPGASLALERYWPPATPTGTVLRGLDEPHTQEQLLRLWRARTVLGLYERARRGPTPGTGAKYESVEEWHAAIREKVLTRPSRGTAPDKTIAYWLDDISTSLLYELMGKWRPSTLEDLRNGKF